jgi:hypothetical protein
LARKALQRRELVRHSWADVQVQSARGESRAVQAFSVPRGRPALGASRVARDGVGRRVHIQVGDSAQALGDFGEALGARVGGQIVQNAAADHEIELAIHAQIVHRALVDIAALPPAANRILAGIDARVVEARAAGGEGWVPVALAAPHVQDGTDGSAEEVLGGAEDEVDLPLELGARFYAARGVPIPSVEIGAIKLTLRCNI